MKYTIVMRGSKESLEEAVNAKLQEGWELQGGVSFIYITSIGLRDYCQAMIKQDNK